MNICTRIQYISIGLKLANQLTNRTKLALVINHSFRRALRSRDKNQFYAFVELTNFNRETVEIYFIAVGNQEIEFYTSFVVEHIFHKAYAVVRVRLLLRYMLHIQYIHEMAGGDAGDSGKEKGREWERKPKLKEYTAQCTYCVVWLLEAIAIKLNEEFD